MSSAIPQQVIFAVESTLGAGAPTSMAVDGERYYCHAPDLSGIVQESVENLNYELHPEKSHLDVPGLKNCTFNPGAVYLHASPNTAAEAAQATSIYLSKLLKCAWGGEKLGYSDGFSGGSASAPEVDTIANHEVGDVIFAVDDTTGDGQFYRVLAKPGGSVLTLDRDLHFTPDVGGADYCRAVIDCFPYMSALTKRNHASFTTLAMFHSSEDSEVKYETRGVKLNASIGAIQAGEPVVIELEALVAEFLHQTAADPGLTAAPSGEAFLVPGTSDDTRFYFGNAGGAMTSVIAAKAEPTIGVKSETRQGFGATEGVIGYGGSGWGSTMCNLSLPFDDAYATDYQNKQLKQLLVQIGSGDTAIGIWFPRLQITKTPPPGASSGDLQTSELEMKALRGTDAQGALSEEDYEALIANFHVLLVA